MTAGTDKQIRAIRRAVRSIRRVTMDPRNIALGLSDLKPGALLYASTFLSDVAEYLDEFSPKLCCLECGVNLKPLRRDAKYCEKTCRQRAYRRRVTNGSAKNRLSAVDVDGSDIAFPKAIRNELVEVGQPPS